jgi:predicted XRE-type DNA-binding protein
MNKKTNNHQVAKNPKHLAEMLNLGRSDLLEWKVRTDVTKQIVHNFNSKKMKITSLANKSGTSRSRITRILKFDTMGISLDVLLRILAETGQTIEIKFLKTA